MSSANHTSSVSDSRSPGLWHFLGAFVAYIVALRIGSALAIGPQKLMLFWPAIGLGVWCVARFGPWMLVPVALGELSRLLTDDWSVALGWAVVLSAGNVLGALVGGGLYRRVVSRPLGWLSDFREPIGWTLAAVVASVIPATNLVLVLQFCHSTQPVSWLSWWIGDVLGILLVSPMLAGLAEAKIPTLTRSRRAWMKGALVVAGSLMLVGLAFGAKSELVLSLSFPALLLVTVGAGSLGVRLLVAGLGVSGILGAQAGRGLLVGAGGLTAANLFIAEVFLIVVVLVGLVLPPLHRRLNLVRPLPLALLLGGWTLSGVLYFWAHISHVRSDEADFGRLVKNAEDGLEQRMITYVDALRGAASFATASPSFGRQEWLTFAATLDLPKRYPGVIGIGVVYPVASAQAAEFQRRVRVESAGDFLVQEIPGGSNPGPEKFVVTHLSSAELNRIGAGVDLASESVRRQAFAEARSSGAPRITSRLTLHQDALHRPGFLLCLPVYRPGLPLTNAAEREAALRLWVYAPFVTEQFLKGALGPRTGKLEFCLFEEGPLDHAHLLYSSAPLRGELPKFSVVHSRPMMGQKFTLGWVRGPNFVPSGQSPLIWIGGSLAVLTLVLGGWVVSIQNFREETEQVVARRTAELRASEERNRLLIESSPVSMVVSQDGKVVFANTAALATIGAKSNTELVGLSVARFVHADSLPSVLERLSRLTSPGQVAPSVEHRLLRLDGTTIDALVQSVAIRFEGTLAYLTSIQDISERKRSADRLARTTELLERTGALARVGGWEVDLTTMKLAWTRQTFEIAEIDTGVEPPLEDGINLFAPEARSAIAAAVQAAIDAGTPYDLKLPIITAKGRHRWVQTQGFAERRDGKSVRLYGTFQDITERVQTESQMRISDLALRSISQGVLIAGPDRRVISANPAFTAMSGYSEAEIVGKSCSILQGAGTDPEIVARLRDAVRNGRGFSGEILNFRKDGAPFINELVISPITDEHGRLTQFIGISRDVSDRKKAEVAIRESQARYERAERGTTDGLWEWDMVADQEYCSPRWLEILGYSAAEAPPNIHAFAQLIHPDDEGRVLAETEASQREKRPFSLEMRLRRKGGDYLWVLSRAMVEYDAGGRPVRMAGAITDISGRIAAEAAQRESDRFARGIADTIPGMVGYWDRELRNRFANQGYLEWFGRTDAEMKDISMPELLGAELFRKNEPYIRAALRGEPQQFEREIVKPGGNIGWVWAQYIPHKIDGEVAGFFAMVTDITAVKVAQEQVRLSDQRFRDLLNSVDAIVWEADAVTFQFTAVSSNAERILGYPVSDWLEPNFWTQHIHAEDRNEAVRYCAACTGRREDHKFEYRFLTKDGRTVWLRDEVRVIEEDGKPRWLRGMMIDTTATRQLEEQLRQSQKLQAVGTLAGGIAHDFNNILSGIYGFTALAQQAAGDQPELQDYLSQVARAGRRAGELVRQILTFSRSRGGDASREPMQLDRVVTEAAKLLRATSPSTIQFTVEVAKDLPLIQGSASQLHQVVMNLGTNAIQAIGSKPGTLGISLGACAVDEMLAAAVPGLRPGAYLCLAVRDTGQGMDSVTQQRAFEPFFTTKGPGQGTGLGLSVVHGIVQSHQGAIRLASEVGRGTTFEIFLPASPAASAQEALPAGEVPRGRGERVLVIDDETVIAQSARLTLERLGYVAASETQVVSALAMLQRDPNAFDLVVSDQTMPLMTGLEFASQLRKVRADLPVIIASGFSSTLTPEAIEAAGVREVLEKPYTIETFAAVVHRNLAGRTNGGGPVGTGA